VSDEAWVAWGIGIAVAVILGVVAWRWPRSPRAAAPAPPHLKLEQVGGLASQKGEPSEHVKAKLQLVNDGGRSARNWQVSITNVAGLGLKLAKVPRRGPMQIASTVSWHQGASVGEVPPDQGRELPDWLWVEGPPSTMKVRLPVAIMADAMSPLKGTLIVTFPSGEGGPAVRFER
jgi:hypothetical protein